MDAGADDKPGYYFIWPYANFQIRIFMNYDCTTLGTHPIFPYITLQQNFCRNIALKWYT